MRKINHQKKLKSKLKYFQFISTIKLLKDKKINFIIHLQLPLIQLMLIFYKFWKLFKNN